MSNGTYDRDANLALLRLYNFEPEMVHVQTVANVLIMALMQLPESDFTLLLHLIPENIQVGQRFVTSYHQTTNHHGALRLKELKCSYRSRVSRCCCTSSRRTSRWAAVKGDGNGGAGGCEEAGEGRSTEDAGGRLGVGMRKKGCTGRAACGGSTVALPVGLDSPRKEARVKRRSTDAWAVHRAARPAASWYRDWESHECPSCP